MVSLPDQLERRAQELEAMGGDPLRVDLLRRARRFKRSWIDMAEALLELQRTAAFEDWGYKDLYAYCAEELLIKRRTVDKLTGSFTAIREHAPHVLEPANHNVSARAIPTFDAVDYFARAMKATGGDEEQHPEIGELREAVFDEARPVSNLKRRFDAVLFAKSPAETALDRMERAQASAKRLSRSLPDIDGLSVDRIAEVGSALDGLCRDLETMIAGAKADVAQAS